MGEQTVMGRKSKSRPFSGASEFTQRWRPNPRDTLDRAQRYSRFVKIMKRVLPMLALVLGAVVLIYASRPSESGRYALTFERLGLIADDLTMVHPRLTGADDDGTPFILTADSALQEDEASLRVRLKNMQAAMTLKDGTPLNLFATQGLLDGDAHNAFVSNGIVFTAGPNAAGQNFEARTASATIDLKAGTVRGDTRIQAKGPMGNITADGFTADKTSKIVVFRGHVAMLLVPSQGEAQ